MYKVWRSEMVEACGYRIYEIVFYGFEIVFRGEVFNCVMV